MVYILTVICILSSVTASGFCLSCTQCVNLNGTQCSGKAVSCPSDEYTCLSAYGVTFMGNKEVAHVFLRLCENRSLCNQFGSIGFSSGRIKSRTTCCFSDNCTPPMPTFPVEVTRKNGLTCQTCISMATNSCIPTTTMACSGDETRCITQAITSMSGTISSTMALRGCSTKEICEGIQEVDVENFKYSAQVTCSDGNDKLQLSRFIFFLSVLLMLRYW
ncbi:phospholipase A2 inhibitor and Ly6/PLAUR domain-containing protein-like [Pelobates fuscus]|uniref:phospholipase A2 inhibitor and Ly6/PLAUR domain-containing protein-like n=1 Tax=Pelobates fuscus TaxID=191477 RepID=UPI002FE43913